MTAEPAPALRAAWTSHEVCRTLFGHFAGSGWAPLVEVQATPERDPDLSWRDETQRPRRIDVLLVRRAVKPGLGALERLAIEVKVSRADFLSDVRNPHKQAPWRALTHRHAYAAPAGLIDPAELPAGSGLIEVHAERTAEHQWKTAKWKVRAPYQVDTPDWPDWLTWTLACRTAWAEGRTKGLLGRQPGDETDPEALRAEVERLTAALRKADTARDRAIDQREAWKTAYAAADGLPCAHCGQPVKPASGGRSGRFDRWKHRDRTDEKACEAARQVLADEAAKHTWDEHYDDTRRAHFTRGGQFPDEPWRAFARPESVLPAPDDPDQSTSPRCCRECKEPLA